MTCFSRISLKVINSVFFMTVWHKRQWIDLEKSLQPTLMEEKLCCVCVLRSPQYYSFWVFKTPSDVQTYTLNSYNMHMKIFSENSPYSSIRERLCTSWCTGHIQQESYKVTFSKKKMLDLGWSVLPHPLYLSDRSH